MKLKKQKKMLTLNRETISDLNHTEMNNANGGAFVAADRPTVGDSSQWTAVDCNTIVATCLNVTKCATACIIPI